MPDKQFTIEPLNPLGLFKKTDPYEFNLNNDDCYVQKYSEDCTIQILSDYVPYAELYQADSGFPANIPVTIEVKATNIQGQTFSVYEITYPFGSLNGRYVAVLGYVDDNNVQQQYESLAVSCKPEHPNTLLFEYANDRNDFGIAFSTGIIFKLRVEAVIRNFKAENNRTIYNDQNEDSVVLDARPFRTFNLIVGVGQNGLIPDWMHDKMNRLFSCNQVGINGIGYSLVDGQGFEIKRPDPLKTSDKPSLSLSTTIQPTQNLSLNKLILAADLPQGYVPMSHYKNYFNQGANFNVTGLFNSDSLLTHIIVTNKGGAPIPTFRVGSTAGADDIVNETEIPADGKKYPINIDQYPNNLYFTGLNGGNVDIYLHWLQFDEKEIVPGRETTIVKMPRNVIVDYIGSADQIDEDFDLNSGLGRAGTDFEKAAICDGRNGTPDLGLAVLVGYQYGATRADVNSTGGLLQIGDTFGENSHVLSVGELPALKGEVNGQNAGGAFTTGAAPYPTQRASKIPVPITGTNGEALQGLAHNNIQKSVYSLKIKFFE